MPPPPPQKHCRRLQSYSLPASLPHPRRRSNRKRHKKLYNPLSTDLHLRIQVQVRFRFKFFQSVLWIAYLDPWLVVVMMMMMAVVMIVVVAAAVAVTVVVMVVVVAPVVGAMDRLLQNGKGPPLSSVMPCH